MKKLKENMKFSELVDMYFMIYAPNKLKAISAYNYDIAVKTHMLPVFGNKKIKDIDVSDVSEFLTTLDLQPSSCRKIKIILSSIFNFGVTQKYFTENPCKGALYKNEKEQPKKHTVKKDNFILRNKLNNF